MTIKLILANATQKLKKHKIQFPHLDAEILLSHVLKKPKEYLFSHGEKKLNKNQIIKFQYLISRRLKGESIAYIVHCKEFYGLNFYVNKNVLVPRPETEIIITNYKLLITNYLKEKKLITTIDVGTGSGCIIVTLAKIFKKTTQNKFIAIDISKKALLVAKKNAKKHKIEKKIKFIHGDLLNPILKNTSLAIPSSTFIEDRNSSLVIIANLPYLTPIQIKKSPSIQHEPKLALDAGFDGLKYYKKLFSQIKTLSKTLKNINILCEIDPLQTIKIKKIIKKNLPEADIQIKKDLAKKNRVVLITHQQHLSKFFQH